MSATRSIFIRESREAERDRRIWKVTMFVCGSIAVGMILYGTLLLGRYLAFEEVRVQKEAEAPKRGFSCRQAMALCRKGL